MKNTIKPSFLERGYGQFPYIIIRRYNALYQQIPIHRIENNQLFEGIFVLELEEDMLGYEGACEKVFECLWVKEQEKGNTLEMCLVMNEGKGCFISKKGKRTYGPIPEGGLLLSVNDEIIQMNRQHFFNNI